MDISLIKHPPADLLPIIFEEFKDLPNVEIIIIDAFSHDHFKENMGTYFPDRKFVVIDLDKCLTRIDWIKLGVFFVPSCWFNMLYAVYHAAAYARQMLRSELTTISNDANLRQMMTQAGGEAEHKMLKWSKTHTVPKISEMEWAGEQLQKLMVEFRDRQDPLVIEQLALLETQAAARANAFASLMGFGDEGFAELMKGISAGRMGIQINGVPYLKAYDVLLCRFAL